MTPSGTVDELSRAGSAEATRLSLIRAAERRFAERGIDAVSIAEILESAQQRNKNAVHHYFGGREGLITAIAEYRSSALNARRSAMLADVRARGGPDDDDVRALSETLVLPLAELLDDEDNYFLGFLARYHLDRSRRRLVDSVDPRVTDSYRDAGRALRRVCRLSQADFEIRFGLVLDMIFTALAGRQALERSQGPAHVSGRAALVSALTDCVVGAFVAKGATS